MEFCLSAGRTENSPPSANIVLTQTHAEAGIFRQIIMAVIYLYEHLVYNSFFYYLSRASSNEKTLFL